MLELVLGSRGGRGALAAAADGGDEGQRRVPQGAGELGVLGVVQGALEQWRGMVATVAGGTGTGGRCPGSPERGRGRRGAPPRRAGCPGAAWTGSTR